MTPVMRVDPTGHFAISAVLVTVVATTLIFAFGGAVVGGTSAAINGEDVGQGIIKGAVTWAMVGCSIGLIITGVGAPAGISNILVTAGVTGVFMLGTSLESQLKYANYANLDLRDLAHSWGAGTVLGAMSGALGYSLGSLFAYYGQMAGLSLAGKAFFKLANIASSKTMYEIGGMIGTLIGGLLSGKLMKMISTDVGVLSHSIPNWLATLIRFIFRFFYRK